MSNEISLVCKATVSKTGTTITNATSTKSLDMTGLNMFHAVINVTSTQARIDSSFTGVDTSANYWVWARNQDTAYAVTLYLDNTTAYPIAVIPPGSFFLTQMVGGKTIYAKAANTPATAENLETMAWEV